MDRAYTGNVEFLREIETNLDFRALLSANTSRPRPVLMSDVKSEKVSWLWHGWIPFGKLSILAGNPGLGKSNLMIDIASRVSRGRSMPFREVATNDPAGVLILSAEDSLSDTIKPRLETADADLKRVRAYKLDDLPDLLTNTDWLEQDITECGASLVVIDPLMSFVPVKLDSHKDQHIRSLLSPIASVADRTGSAIVFVHHLNKTNGGPAVYRASGSIGIVGAARSAILLDADPGDPSRRILAHMKGNLCKPPQSIRFHIEADEGEQHPRISWEGIAEEHTADTLLQSPADTSEERSQRANAEEFLLETLADGPVHSKDLPKLAKDAGLTWRTVERALKSIGAKRRRVGGTGADGHWETYLDQ
jgi:hypothetical protein